MINLFDNIFYIVYRFYQKRDGTPAIYASGVLTLMQFLALIDLMFLSQLFYKFEVPSKFVFIPVLILLIAMNWFKYERNYDLKNLEARWEKLEAGKRKERGWLLVVSLVSLVLLPIILGVLEHNLGVT